MNRFGTIVGGGATSPIGSIEHRPSSSFLTSRWKWRIHTDEAPSGSAIQSEPSAGSSPDNTTENEPVESSVRLSLSSRDPAEASSVPDDEYAVIET